MKLTWSFTMLKTFENCAHKGWHMYILKDLPKPDSEQMRWGNEVHKALDRRVKAGFELPDTMAAYEPMAAAIIERSHQIGSGADVKLGTEEKLGITMSGKGTGFFSDDVWGRGAIDVLMVKEPVALIVDWKTGKRREDAAELETFALLLQASRPAIRNIYGVYVWLQDGEIGPLHNISDTGTTWASIKRQMDWIGGMQRDQNFPKMPNPLCGGDWGSCPVTTCEFRRGNK